MLIKDTRTARRILYYVVFILLCAALIFTSKLVRLAYGYYESSDWISVKAHLLHASIDTNTVSDPNTRVTHITHAPNVSYEYYYNDIRYTGNRATWVKVFDESDMFAKARLLKSRYENNKFIYVYIDPDSPTESVIYKEVDGGLLLTLFIPKNKKTLKSK